MSSSSVCAGDSTANADILIPLRRRRTSLSNKLFWLFASKHKTLPPPQRPTISLPQPLDRRASSSKTPTPAQAEGPAKRKRDRREASLDTDENAHDTHSRRATPRPRLDSSTFSRTDAPPPPPPSPIRPSPTRAPLKSALKHANASQAGVGVSPLHARTTTAKSGPLSSAAFSHTRSQAGAKGAPKASTQHNRAGSVPDSCPSSFSVRVATMSGDKRHTTNTEDKSLLPLPFPTQLNHPRRVATHHENEQHPASNRPLLKKRVTFADRPDDDDHPAMSLKRTRTLRDISDATDHWADLALQIEELDARPAPSTTSTTATRRTSAAASHRRKSDPAASISAKSPRARRPVPLPPKLTKDADPALPPARDASVQPRVGEGATDGTDTDTDTDAHDHAQFRALLERQAPPTPSATPFELPPSNSSRTKEKGKSKTAVKAKGKATADPATKENRTLATALLDEVLMEIARDQEERERERSRGAVQRQQQHQQQQYQQQRLTLQPGSGRSGVFRRFKVDIVPGARHTTIWDGGNTDIYAWSGTLEVRDAKPPSYFYPRHCIQDLWIKFHTVDEPGECPVTFDPTAAQSPSSAKSKYEWETTYTGFRFTSSTPSSSSSSPTVPVLDAARGIAVEHAHRLQPGGDPDGPCTWLVRFWVPVPLRLFARAEHRTFVCRARVTVKDWDTPRAEVPAGCTAVGIERLWTERVLRRGREGEGTW
ncbi:hypothetical protein OH77DRAFT_1522730 [Trametes cingulata]|nr:hypothetical protein OH77DRAFT_1522730 [Trametes cingulata]